MLSLPPLFIPLHLKLLLQSHGGSRQLQDRVFTGKTYTTASSDQENLHGAQRAVKTCNIEHPLLLMQSSAAQQQVQVGVPGHCCCMLAFSPVLSGSTATIACIKRTSHQVHCDYSPPSHNIPYCKKQNDHCLRGKNNRWGCGNQWV